MFNLQKNVKEQTQMFLKEMFLKAIDNICQDYEVILWRKEIAKIKEI